MRNRGFTLVELSIVLVIIGLLIGGILVGQSLVESAKLQSFIREYQQYKVAIEQFDSRYNSLPGDTSLFPVTGGRGTATANDGAIHDASTNVNDFDGEIAAFWKHLSDSGMLQEKYSDDASSGIVAGEHAPEVVYNNLTFIAVEPSLSGSPSSHYFAVADLSGTTTTSTNGYPAVLDTITALAIDTKIDDGLALHSLACFSTFNCDVEMYAYIDSCWNEDAATYPKTYDVTSDTLCPFLLKYK